MKHSSADTSLVRSFATESLSDLLGGVSDVALDAAIDSGVLDQIPVIGFFTGAMKVQHEYRGIVFMRKIAVFLREFSMLSIEERLGFTQQFQSEDEQFKFGEALLLQLERADHMEKPAIAGRLIAAAARGELELSKAQRVISIVDRAYFEDIVTLPTFKDGVQDDESTPIAEALQGVGLVSSYGYDGATLDLRTSAGVKYRVNEYGNYLVRFGLSTNG